MAGLHEDLAALPADAIHDLKQMLAHKAAELFAICDQEDKGFVTKRDMQRMRGELPLDPQQLEDVFDTLDCDANGYLTLDEFRDGFGSYLGLHLEEDSAPSPQSQMQQENAVSAEIKVNGAKAEQNAPDESHLDDEDEFHALLSELGLLDLVEDDSGLRDMWQNLKRDYNPELMANFEAFLAKLSEDLRKRSSEHETFESAIRSRSQLQEDHLHRLYDEMEQQICAEKERIRLEESRKESKLREELGTTLKLKDQKIAEATRKMIDLQRQLDEATKAVPEIRDENAELNRERDRLQQEVERQRILMRELQDHLDTVRTQATEERRQRAKAAFKVSENIAQERENLVGELALVRAINTKMLDEQDSAAAANGAGHRGSEAKTLAGELLAAQGPKVDSDDGSDSSDAVNIIRLNLGEGRLNPPVPDTIPLSDFECDDDIISNANPALAKTLLDRKMNPKPRPRTKGLKRYSSQPSHDNVSLMEELADSLSVTRSEDLTLPLPFAAPDSISSEEAHGQRASRRQRRRPLDPPASSVRENINSCRYSTSVLICNIDDRRSRPQAVVDGSLTSCTGPASFGESSSASTPSSLTSQSLSNPHRHHPRADRHPAANLRPYEPMQQPERVFKVIFIGDSSVGKSSVSAVESTFSFSSSVSPL
jgi:Ras and EF-hand domain-containing protein